MPEEKPHSFEMLIDLIQQTVGETIKAEIPTIVSDEIFGLLGAAWQSGYIARDPIIQHYVGLADEMRVYAAHLNEMIDTQQAAIQRLEAEIRAAVQVRVATQ